MKIITMALSLLLMTTTARGQAISIDEMPAAIGDCYATSACLFGRVPSWEIPSALSTPRMEVYEMIRDWSDRRWLFRYSPAPPSGLETRNYFDEISFTPYSGYLWLEVRQNLDLDGTNVFTVYRDQVTRNAGGWFGLPPDPMSFGMTSAVAASGSGYAWRDEDWGQTSRPEEGTIMILASSAVGTSSFI